MTTIDSLERSIKNSFESLGGNNVYIQKWPWAFDGEYPWWKYINRPIPKMWEAEKIKESANTVENAVFCASSSQTISCENKSLDNIAIILIPFDYNLIKPLDIEVGRYFSQLECMSGNNVAIIGHSIAEKIFEGSDPIGNDIKVSGKKSKIIGVLKKTGGAMFDDGMDNAVIIPLIYGKSIFNIESENLNPYIIVTPKEGISIDMLIDELTVVIRNIRKLKPLEEENFSINQSNMLSQMLDKIFGVLDIAAIIIGGFAILVGGFGIANIMFVSVKERTKQIGVQKAIGAKSYLIMVQFLTESIVLCLVGGLIGLFLVWILMLIASSLLPLDFALSFKNIITGTLISVVIGIISGYAPARKAAKLDPVVAMNHI